jgi:hypothetical protein
MRSYGGKDLPDKTFTETVDDAADVVLYIAFAGADNCFPHAPNIANGIAGPVFGNRSQGNDISWPVIYGGSDTELGFVIERSVLSRCQSNLPPGYDPDPKFIRVELRTNLLGPSLR